MSLHYILDGYNIIKHPEFYAINKSKDKRPLLIKFIEEKRPCGSKNNKVTLVFDGEGLPLAKGENLDIIFSHNETADDKIREMVSRAKNPKNMVVVTDDREIKFFIKSYGARPEGVEEFIEKAKGPSQELQETPKIELTYSQVQKINAELKRIWLK
jgi:predicted RNA-binding protein with PIN domain